MCCSKSVAGLFISSSKCKLPRCSSKAGRMSRPHMHTVEYYTTKENKRLTHRAWVSLRNGVWSTGCTWVKCKGRRADAEQSTPHTGTGHLQGCGAFSLDLSAGCAQSMFSLQQFIGCSLRVHTLLCVEVNRKLKSKTNKISASPDCLLRLFTGTQ